MSDLKAWDDATPKTDVSLEVMSEMIKLMRDKQEVYDKAKAAKATAYEGLELAKQSIVKTLQAAGLKRFNVPELGTASVTTKYKVTVPKGLEDKRKLFSYIRDKYGADVLDETVGINYQTLNAFYKSEAELAAGEGVDLQIPGLDAPTVDFGIMWRKDKPGG